MAMSQIDRIRKSMASAGVTQADVARHLGLDRSAISRLFSGHRKLSVDEAESITEYLRARGIAAAPADGASTPPRSVRGISVVGHIAPGIWTDEHTPLRDGRTIAGIIDSRYSLDDQVAHEILNGSSGPVQRGDFVISVPFDRYRTAPQPSDFVVAERRNGHLIATLLCRHDGTDLIDVSTGAPAPSDAQITRLVIALHRPLA